MRVDEYDPLESYMSNKIRMVETLGDLNRDYKCNLWCDLVQPGTAKVLAKYTEDYYAGYACLTENLFGKGKAYYIATQPEPDFIKDFLKYIMDLNDISSPLPVPAGVEVIKRAKNGQEYLFILNHNSHQVEFSIPGAFQDLISGNDMQNELILKSKDTVILKEV